MHVIAIHSVSDPEGFWAAASSLDPPEGVTLHSTLPNDDGTRAVCVWEANSVDAVRDFVDGNSAGMSSNEFFEVNPENARGLPA
jgi:hypothetical protein